MKKVVNIDFKDRKGKWVRSFKIPGTNTQIMTWLGQKYKSMKDRSKISGAEQRRYRHYEGTSTTFEDFQDFAEWAILQKGYGEFDWELDKDLLSNGSKVYCKEFSVFIPKEINLLFNKVYPLRGDYPIGVTYYQGKYKAKIKYDNKNKHLGTFKTKEDAFLAYKIAKEDKVKSLAIKYEDIIDVRCFDLMLNFEVKEYD